MCSLFFAQLQLLVPLTGKKPQDKSDRYKQFASTIGAIVKVLSEASFPYNFEWETVLLSLLITMDKFE